MAQYARPDSDVATGTWAQSEGPDLHSCIDEIVADDDDYISTGNHADDCQFTLSDVVDPESSANHVLRVRYKTPLEDSFIDIELSCGAEIIYTVPGGVQAAGFTTFSHTLTAEQADDISDYTDLLLEFRYRYVTGVDTGFVSWAELEVPDAPLISTLLSPRLYGRCRRISTLNFQ